MKLFVLEKIKKRKTPSLDKHLKKTTNRKEWKSDTERALRVLTKQVSYLICHKLTLFLKIETEI